MKKFCKFTSNLRGCSCDKSSNESTDDTNAQSTKAAGEERGQSQGNLRAADVFHRREGHHHRIQYHRYGICIAIDNQSISHNQFIQL